MLAGKSRHFPEMIAGLLLGLALLVSQGAAAQTPPPARNVFQLSASTTAGGGLALRWMIAPGNYLYRDRIGLKDDKGETIAVALPPGVTKDDPNFGPTQVFHDSLVATVAQDDLKGTPTLLVSYQGCAERGICYPPVTSRVDIATGTVAPAPAGPALDVQAFGTPVAATAPEAQQDGDTTAASFPGLSATWPQLLLTFTGLGLLLAFTPCVFPMIPILAGLLSRSGRQLGAMRGFTISATYVAAMALAYAVLGIAAAWSGQNLQASLQTPLALGVMAAIFVALALSSFGLFELRLPSRWMNAVSVSRSPGGTFAGAAALGFTSALIVGPCVTPPLAGALLYVARTGDMLRGAAALFALGLGMGLPLIAFGTFGAGILPRSGPWLQSASRLFGIVFLGLAITLVGRLVAPPAALALWGLLALGTAVFIGGFDRIGPDSPASLRLRKTAGLAAAIYGAALLAGAAGGGDDPLQPLARLTMASTTAATPAPAATVASDAAFDQALASARQAGKPILVDFTAGWCTACKDMDRDVLSDPGIRAQLEAFTVIRADVTQSNAGTAALMRRFGVVGPPTLIVLSPATGKEIAAGRTTGATTVESFRDTLERAARPG